LKIKPLGGLETPETNYPATRCHIQKEEKPELHHCKTLKMGSFYRLENR
jgi:hypothetical protein